MVGVDTYLEYLRRRGHEVPKYGRPSLPKVWAKEPRVLTVDEIGLYFDLADEAPEPARTILLLFPLCGLRSDEIVRLRLDSLAFMDGWVVFKFLGKGRKPRDVPLLKQGNIMLREYLSGWRAKQDAANPWLFPGHLRGDHVSTRTIRKWAEWVSREMAIPELSPHSLRATYSTMLDSMGVSPFKIAQMMGHSNMRTTQQSYVRHSFHSLVDGLAKVVLPTSKKKVA
jgi:integrase/recombinase XerC